MILSARVFLLVSILILVHSFPSPSILSQEKNSEVEFYPDNIDERGIYYGGDMVISESDLQEMRAGLIDTRRQWANKQFVYKINGGFTTQETATIKDAMKMIASKTCITFLERTTEKDYVSIGNGESGCYSYVGRIGGSQALNLGRGCVSKGVAGHEMIHAIGFEHEHQRTDRDDYVTINFDNIEKDYHYAFEKYGANRVSPFNVSYDYGSLMHYGAGAFAKDSRKPSITVKQSGAKIGQRQEISVKDAQKINNMYNCTK